MNHLPASALDRLNEGGLVLVILDVMLPDRDGFSVLRKIREKSRIPVIMLTTRSAVVADCVPITTESPWSCNSQWLDLVARSGTVLLVSPQPTAMGREQREAVRAALAIATSEHKSVVPEDWQTSTTPSSWGLGSSSGAHKVFDWHQHTGAWPFQL